jgi:hypothetical protein
MRKQIGPSEGSATRSCCGNENQTTSGRDWQDLVLVNLRTEKSSGNAKREWKISREKQVSRWRLRPKKIKTPVAERS